MVTLAALATLVAMIATALAARAVAWLVRGRRTDDRPQTHRVEQRLWRSRPGPTVAALIALAVAAPTAVPDYSHCAGAPSRLACGFAHGPVQAVYEFAAVLLVLHLAGWVLFERGVRNTLAQVRHTFRVIRAETSDRGELVRDPMLLAASWGGPPRPKRSRPRHPRLREWHEMGLLDGRPRVLPPLDERSRRAVLDRLRAARPPLTVRLTERRRGERRFVPRRRRQEAFDGPDRRRDERREGERRAPEEALA